MLPGGSAVAEQPAGQPFGGVGQQLAGLDRVVQQRELALLQGDLTEADSLFAAAVEHCLRSGNFPGVAAAEAERAVIALDRCDRASAAALAESALAIVEKGHIEAYVHSTVVYAVAARTAAIAGDMRKAVSKVRAEQGLEPSAS